jgi:ATP-dependent Clp protease protease subunit
MKQPNFNVVMLSKGKARVEIYDVIGPSWLGMIDTKLVAKQLKEAGELNEIEVRINSPGGSAYDGLAIHNLLKDHPAKVTVVVDGVAASAASLIAMAGDTVRIPKNALMMLHEPSTFAFGNMSEMRKTIEQLEAVNSASIETYAAKTKQPSERVAAWLKEETWFTGQEAVEAGLADTTDKEISKPPAESKAAAAAMFSRTAPTELASLFAVAMQATSVPQETPKMEDQKPAETPATPPAPPATPPAPQLTAADVKAAADKSVAEERTRVSGIMSVCQKAGKPEMANDFIANGATLADVQNRMFEVLCAARPPVGDAGGNDAPAANDPDAEFKAEYAKDRAILMKSGVSEADYVTSRRISAGLEPLLTR